MPSAASPRVRAARTPGSSSTTSTRGMAPTLAARTLWASQGTTPRMAP
jgi:hypothetical protein